MRDGTMTFHFGRIDMRKVLSVKSLVAMIMLGFCFETSSFAACHSTYNLSVTSPSTEKQISIRFIILDNKSGNPLQSAVASASQYGIYTVSDKDGKATLKNIPKGKCRISIELLGYVKETVEINPETEDQPVTIKLKEENLSIDGVVVVAQRGSAGESTSSIIGRQALDHIQATSLKDIFQLLPGNVVTSNPSLTTAGVFQNRTLDKYDSNNSFGAAIVVDGVPMSINADMNTKGGNGSTSGVDMRSIGTDDIESVEVVRGIASAEYGDLSSGTMIVKSKVGVTDLKMRAKIYPGIYQFYAGKGLSLKKAGTLNINADYARGKSDPRYKTDTYDRVLASLVHSINTKNGSSFITKLSTTNTYEWSGADPDEKITDVWKTDRNNGFQLSHSGSLNTNRLFVRTLKYDLSYSFKKSDSYTRAYMSGLRPVVNATKEGTYETIMLPSEYYGCGGTVGKPLTFFAKLSDSFYLNSRNSLFKNRFNLGTEFRSEGNVGRGYEDDDPLKPLSSSGYRPRSFKDIPFLNQISAWAEDNINLRFSKTKEYPVLNLQAGLRWTMIQPGLGKQMSTLSPRINASFAANKWVSLRLGFGISEKTPSLLSLYPERTYLDYLNVNASNGEDRYLTVFTTRIFDRNSLKLKPMRNIKYEVGADFKTPWGQSISIIAYRESVRHGFGSDNSVWKTVSFNHWDATDVRFDGNMASYDKGKPSNVQTFLTNILYPANTDSHISEGIELDCNLGQIRSSGTSFYLTGSYSMTKSETERKTYMLPKGYSKSYSRIYLAYPAGMNGSERRQGTMVLRVVQSIPKLNFVLSGTVQTIFYDYTMNSRFTAAPEGYIIAEENVAPQVGTGMNEYVAFTSDQLADPDYSFPENWPSGERFLLKEQIFKKTAYSDVPETWPPLWVFNLRVTKDITKFLGTSFYVNNLFFSQPWHKSSVSSSVTERNSNLFSFGIELYVNL